MCTCDEHWLLHGSVESLYRTPENNLTLCANYTGIRIKKKSKLHEATDLELWAGAWRC